MTGISFRDRVAVVTGGARGLGAAYCRELARRGAAVVVHDNGAGTSRRGHDPPPAYDVADSIVGDGANAAACVSDASTEHGGRQAVDMAIQKFDRLDVIVANAGIIHDDSLEDLPDGAVRGAIEPLPVRGVTRCASGLRGDEARRLRPRGLRIVRGGGFRQPWSDGLLDREDRLARLDERRRTGGCAIRHHRNAIMPMAGTRMALALVGEAADTADGRAFLDTLRVDQVAPFVAKNLGAVSFPAPQATGEGPFGLTWDRYARGLSRLTGSDCARGFLYSDIILHGINREMPVRSLAGGAVDVPLED